MNKPELPSCVDEIEDGVFVWRRNVRSTRNADGVNVLYPATSLNCLPAGGTTIEELEAVIAVLRSRQLVSATDDRHAGVSPAAAIPFVPAKRRGRPPKTPTPDTP